MKADEDGDPGRGALGGGAGWRRRKWTTVARAGVVLAIMAGYVVTTSRSMHIDDRVVSGFVEWVAVWWIVGPAIAYVVTLGLVVDHLSAPRGFWWNLVAHAVSLMVFLPVAFAFAAARLGVEYDGVATLIGFVMWPAILGFYVLLVYVVAWLVPGSFPRQPAVYRAIGRAVRHPAGTARLYAEGTPEHPVELPSRARGTDWL